MKITILYDNEALGNRLTPDWGFAALIQTSAGTILFDTGASGSILLANMEILKISPKSIDEIFISHNHWDHTGGLQQIIDRVKVPVYVPDTIARVENAQETIPIAGAEKLHEDIWSTGTLSNMEQSLCILKDGRAVIIAGCCHPGVENILSAAQQIGQPAALIGGLHGFSDLGLLSSLEMICPTHCTQRKHEILSMYPETALAGGAGRVIEI